MGEWVNDFDSLADGMVRDIETNLPPTLARAAEYIRGVAAPLTPVDTGHLVGSAGVTVDGYEARVTYPGPYARYQHYELHLRHTVGQALYLEQPMITEAQTVLKIIADGIGGTVL